MRLQEVADLQFVGIHAGANAGKSLQHHPQRRVHYPQLLDAQMADAVPQTSRVHRHRLFHHDAGPGAGDLDPGPEGGRPAACRSASRTAVDTEVPSTVSSSRARRVS